MSDAEEALAGQGTGTRNVGVSLGTGVTCAVLSGPVRTKRATHLSHSEAVVKSVISNTSDSGCGEREGHRH